MTNYPNKAAVRRFFDEVWAKGNLSVIEEVYHRDFMDHDSNGASIGTEALRRAIEAYRSELPDLRFTIEDLLAEGDKVVTRWRARATRHGKAIDVTGIRIDRFENGKIAEEWENWDALGYQRQSE
jgi:predicted ester cyclase